MHNLGVDTFKRAGIEGDYRVLRRTHEQILMDRLEAHDYKEGSIIEISAKRLRHSMQTAVRHYADLRTAGGQKAAQEWKAAMDYEMEVGAEEFFEQKEDQFEELFEEIAPELEEFVRQFRIVRWKESVRKGRS